MGYKNVVGGKLSFLKSDRPGKKKKKSKKKKKKKKEEKKIDLDAENEDYLKGLTATEKQFLERQLSDKQLYLKKQAERTHRQKIDAFNDYLNNLSEIHDIPKVGPG